MTRFRAIEISADTLTECPIRDDSDKRPGDWETKRDQRGRKIEYKCYELPFFLLWKIGGYDMCGIVGYIGSRKAAPILLEGLSRLEYRGYDSAGIATIENGELAVEKCKGRLKNLCDKIHNGETLQSCIGIGHTRWATHGAPSDLNSHPHTCSQSLFTVVHNGIIENYLTLKEELSLHKGVPFVSDTDTEVIAHLLSYYYNGDVLETIERVINAVEGSFALGILCRDTPNVLYAVKKDSPLIVGKGEGENFIASDIPALLHLTRDFYLVDDGEIVELKKDSITFMTVSFIHCRNSLLQWIGMIPRLRRVDIPTLCLRKSTNSKKRSMIPSANGFWTMISFLKISIIQMKN